MPVSRGGFTSIGNATGICDTGSNETTHRRLLIRDCTGFDLCFLDTWKYTASDSVVISSAARAVYLQGRDRPTNPCYGTLGNVLIRRKRTENKGRVSANCDKIRRMFALPPRFSALRRATDAGFQTVALGRQL